MKILVVEDNRDIAENIADYFEPLGHVLDFAMDGMVGRHLATNDTFDVIVLDVMLPRVDGMTLCRQLREELDVNTPILMLTAKDQLADKLQGFDSGADDYLVKPFSVRELEARLMALVKRSKGNSRRSLLKVSDLEFDPKTCMASRAGKALDLNPIQRNLLELLMAQSPKVITREDLETRIWGKDPPDRDILRTHIYNLRTIIDKPFASKLLHTVHGVGYRLGEQEP